MIDFEPQMDFVNFWITDDSDIWANNEGILK